MTQHPSANRTSERSLAGHSFGRYAVEGDQFLLNEGGSGRPIFGLSLKDVAQSVPIGTREISVELQLDSTAPPDEEQVNEIRFFVPGEEDLNNLKSAFAMYSTSSVITTLPQVSLLLPRGHHDLEFSLASVKFRGKTNTFNVKFANITRLFLLPRGDVASDVLVVLQLDHPVRLGATSYPFLVLNIDKNEAVTDIAIDATPELPDLPITTKDQEKLLLDLLLTLFRAFNSRLSPVMPHESYPHAIRCSHRAFDGSVYMLKRGLIFVVKPVVYLPWTDVTAVELMRASVALGGRFFDLRVFVKGGSVLDFQQIDRAVYPSLVAELQNLGVKIRNLDASGLAAAPAASRDQPDLDQPAGMDLDDSEDDESYQDSGSASSGASSDSDSSDDSDSDSSD
jgi:structure-specific recognition protein 1